MILYKILLKVVLFPIVATMSLMSLFFFWFIQKNLCDIVFLDNLWKRMVKASYIR
jgi:hypothetical protein